MPIVPERVKALLRHRVVKNALYLYGVQFSSYIFPLITLPYLSRVLNPDRFGLIAFAQGGADGGCDARLRPVRCVGGAGLWR